MGDIIVRATIGQNSNGHWLIDLDRLNSSTYEPVYNIGSDGLAGGSSNDAGANFTVAVTITNDNNMAAAEQAAINVARALAKIFAELNDLPPNQSISWGDRTMSASQVLNEFLRTDYVITDENYSNGGFGEALRSNVPNVSNRVELNYTRFDGDLANSNGRDYAASTYTNDSGMVGILLHELGHVTQSGHDFDHSSKENYRREHGGYAGYANSDYWQNNENFANAFSVEVAQEMQFDISQLSSGWETFHVSPLTIYNTNMGHSPIMPIDENSFIMG